MNDFQHDEAWQDNVILVDMDYVDQLVWQWSIQLERMLERRMPPVDLTRWCDYLALDGGLAPGNHKIQLLMVYTKPNENLKNIIPSNLKKDLDGKAFKDNLGEFLCASAPVEENVTTLGGLFAESAAMLVSSQKVKRLMLVADMDSYGADLKKALAGDTCKDKDITLFVQTPMMGMRHVQQEIITYSLLAVLGVKAEELGL